MNKKLNTILFILGATIFNMLVTILTFVVLTIVYIRFILPVLSESAQMWYFPLIFIISMAVAFIVYRYTLRFLMKKIDIEKYFDALFISKQRKKTTPSP